MSKLTTNGHHSQVTATWDQFNDSDFPTPRHVLARWGAAVEHAAKTMADSPVMAPRLAAAIELVLAECVQPMATGYTVQSGEQHYTVHPQEGCPCEDSRYRSKFCKHFVACLLHDLAERRYQGDTPSHSRPTTANGQEAEATNYVPTMVWLKARVGDVEISWRLCGSDADVPGRVQEALQYMATLHAPEAPVVVDVLPVQPQLAPVQRPSVPRCDEHGSRTVRPSKKKGVKWFCTAKLDDDTFCDWEQR